MSSLPGIHLRPLQLGDAEVVAEAVAESIRELRPWMPWCHASYSVADARAFLDPQAEARASGTAFEFAILSADGRYLGACGLNQIDKANRRANLGYWVRATEAGRGVATAAVTWLRDWAFAHTDLLRLEIVVAAGNDASHRVAEKSGAFREGTLRKRLLLHGAAHDASIFSFVRTEGEAGVDLVLKISEG